jgi:hypothetical protein
VRSDTELATRALLAAVGRSVGQAGERVVGGILAKPGVLPYDMIMIDVGRELGVVPGLLVLAPGDAPIGTVVESARGVAKVRLFSSAGEKHEALIGESALPIELRGIGGGVFSAEIPREAGIAPGDLVYWPESPLRALGIVERLEGDETDPLARAYIRYRTPLFELRWVEVEISAPSDMPGMEISVSHETTSSAQ